jgi:endonuclease-3
MTPAAKIGPILQLLERYYPEAHVTLDFKNPLEMLVATVLSAQCTDVRVNQVTPALFAKYPAAADYAQAPIEELEEMIRSTGFFRNKAKSIKALCQKLVDTYNGEVPASLDELVKLPGIGRKTANVVLGNAFGIPGIFVDTHLGRVSQRLGLTTQKDPVKIEFDLMPLIPEERWVKFSHQMIAHGRQICDARKPKCSSCPLLPYCDFGQQAQAAPKNSDPENIPAIKRWQRR